MHAIYIIKISFAYSAMKADEFTQHLFKIHKKVIDNDVQVSLIHMCMPPFMTESSWKKHTISELKLFHNNIIYYVENLVYYIQHRKLLYKSIHEECWDTDYDQN